jgi:hypothetical protein
MTHTISRVKQGIAGDLAYVIADLDITSYDATPGEALTAAEFGLNAVLCVQPMGASAYLFNYDATNQLLYAYTGAGHTHAIGDHTHDMANHTHDISHTHSVTAAKGGTGTDYLVNDAGVIMNLDSEADAAVDTSAASTTDSDVPSTNTTSKGSANATAAGTAVLTEVTAEVDVSVVRVFVLGY